MKNVRAPSHIESFGKTVTVTLFGLAGFTFIVMVAVAVGLVTQVIFEVISQVTTSPLAGAYENVLLVDPCSVPPTNH